MTNREKLAYIAGIIDGEGYIGVAKRRTPLMTSPKYTIRIGISMCEADALLLAKEVFGISRNFSTRRRRNPAHRPCLCLDLENYQAARIVRAVRPFLRVKREQADIVLRLYSHQRRTKSTRRFAVRFHGTRSPSGLSPSRILLPSYLAACEASYRACKLLNARGRGR